MVKRTQSAEELAAQQALMDFPVDSPAAPASGSPSSAVVADASSVAAGSAPASTEAPALAPALSWRDEVIGDDEPTVELRGRKRGEVWDQATRTPAPSPQQVQSVQAAERRAIELEAELKALREGRVVLPPKTEAAPPGPPPLPFGAASEEEIYGDIPGYLRKAQEHIAKLEAQIAQVGDTQAERLGAEAQARINIQCDEAYERARLLVNPNIPAAVWKEWQRSIVPLMAENALMPDREENWAWAANRMRLGTILAAAPATTVVERRSSAPPVGGAGTSAVTQSVQQQEERATTGSPELDGMAAEIAQISAKNAQRRGGTARPISAQALVADFARPRRR